MKKRALSFLCAAVMLATLANYTVAAARNGVQGFAASMENDSVTPVEDILLETVPGITVSHGEERALANPELAQEVNPEVLESTEQNHSTLEIVPLSITDGYEVYFGTASGTLIGKYSALAEARTAVNGDSSGTDYRRQHRRVRRYPS